MTGRMARPRASRSFQPDIEDRIGFEHVEHAFAGVEREGLALAPMQKVGDRVGAREHDLFDR